MPPEEGPDTRRSQDDPCPEDVQDRFGPIARYYDVIDVGFAVLGSNPRLAVASAIPADARTILDLGTGTGSVLATVAQTHCDAEITGLDASAPMLERAERKLAKLSRRGSACADTTLVCGSAAALPFDDDAFEAVTASFFFHELPPDVRNPAFDEAARVLAPGGSMVVMDLDRRPAGLLAPVQWALDVLEEDYAWELSGDALSAELVSRGLTDPSSDTSIGFMQLVVAGKP